MKKIVPILVCLVFGFAIINSCKKDPVIPTLTTKDVTNITINSATTGGSITKDGGAGVTARGVCWGTSENPAIAGSHTSDDSGVGIFISNITGLTPNTVYHIRAYATNKAGTAYGVDISFTTKPLVVPTVTTTAITSITLTTAVSGGNITDDGNADITAKGVCWATTAGPTITSSLTTDGTGKGSFVSNLSGLQPGITYFLRAYATNSAGTSYGNEITFTTIAVVVPTLTTAGITAIILTTAASGGNISTDGGGVITARGTCWATTPVPTIAKSKTSDATGTGSFVSNLTGLLPGTLYYVRAYATNSKGTSYGNELSFYTKIADADGNIYSTVLIGAQLWMGENLKTTKYSNGVSIGTTVTPSDNVTGLTTPYQWPVYNGGIDISATYGRLYTWYAVTDSRNICPTGWHVPTDTELEALKTTLGGELVAGGKLKEAGLIHWTTPNTGATNNTGFTALPAGYRQPGGGYVSLGLSCYLWSSNPDDTSLGWGQQMSNNTGVLLRGGYIYQSGISVRCLK